MGLLGLIFPIVMVSVMGYAMFDLLNKRSFKDRGRKQLFFLLIIFPPLFGALIYLFLVKRTNRYAKGA